MAQINSLQEYQSPAIDEVLVSIRFKVNCGGAPEVESPPLDILASGLRLHFFRRGLFLKEPEEGKEHLVIYAPDKEADHDCDLTYKEPYVFHQINLDDAIVGAELDPPEGASTPEQYHYYRTAIREGYIYIFDEANRDFHKEYKVDTHGNLTNITWDHPTNKKDGEYQDIRRSTPRDIKRRTSYHLVKQKGTQLRVCFSPVQWSVAYHKKIRTSDALRATKMQLVDCSGIPKNADNCLEDIYPCKDVLAYFNHDQHREAMWLNGKLIDITNDEAQQQDEIYEDMFVTLDDPFGCADTICKGVEKEINHLQTLMISCQTGMSLEDITTQIQCEGTLVIEDTPTNRQLHHMHLLAIGTYKFIFDNPEVATKYRGYEAESTANKIVKYTPTGLIDRAVGKILNKEHGYGQSGASRKKLEKILAVKERAQQRSIINSYRDDLGNFMNSDYYQDVYDDYLEALEDFIEDGKGIAIHHKYILSMYPNQFDRTLDLDNVYKIKEDIWMQNIAKTLEPNPDVFKKSTAVLDKKLCWLNIVSLSLTKKTTTTMGKIFKAYAHHGDLFDGKMNFKLNNKVCYLFRDHQTRDAVMKFEKANLKEFMAYHKKEIDFGAVGNSHKHIKEYKIRMHKRYGNLPKKTAQQLIDDGKVHINLKNVPKKHTAAVKEFVNSSGFATVVLTFEILSLAEAVKEYQKKDSELNKYLAIGAGIKLAAAIVTLSKNTGLEEQVGRKLAKREVKKLGNELMEEAIAKSLREYSIASNALKVVGSSITVITAIKDAYITGSYRDYDAMAVYATAGAVGSVFVIADISLYFGTGALALGFWPAAILGGVLIGLYAIAKLLEDSEMEAYFKNYPLSDYAVMPTALEKPHQYMHRLYKAVDRAVEPSNFESISEPRYIKYRNFETAYIGFMDMLAPNTIAIGPRYDMGTTLTYDSDLHAHRFRAYVQFFQYFEDSDQLDIKIWFYPNGISDHNNRLEITLMTFDFETNRQFLTENQPSRCYVDFTLPSGYRHNRFGKMLYPKGEILFLCRLKTNDNRYIPLEQNNEPRYYYNMARVYNQIDLRTPRTYYDFDAINLFMLGVRNLRTARIKNTEPEDAERVIRLKDVPLLQSYPLT
ncbi:toxin VasX [Aquimarina sp. I32.4]|uniref:toxin VasX n=1 Tax=Aquimarina sp. I32.4 TaxID=2053903 RepID=UPI000CDE6870|nr:toxin VasX [Aquimarina sp. I32.4]